jgi:hypothetical protein
MRDMDPFAAPLATGAPLVWLLEDVLAHRDGSGALIVADAAASSGCDAAVEALPPGSAAGVPSGAPGLEESLAAAQERHIAQRVRR